MHEKDAGFSESRVVLRTARPADLPAVSILLEASFSHLLAGSYEANTLEIALPYMIKANPALLACGTYYVAEVEHGAVVGCGGWTLEEPGSGAKVNGEAHIRHFAVHPEWARRGIGKALLSRCFAEAELAGVHKLRCISSLNAEPFYRASGFQTMGSVDVRMGQTFTFTAVIMQRELP